MKISRCGLQLVVIAFLGTSFLLWPVFVLLSTVIGYLFVDGELAFRFLYQPRRLLFVDIIEGYKYTMPATASLALLSILILLLYRNTVFRSVLLIAVPAIFAAVFIVVYLPFSVVNLLLVTVNLFFFLFFFAICAYFMQRCGHA